MEQYDVEYEFQNDFHFAKTHEKCKDGLSFFNCGICSPILFHNGMLDLKIKLMWFAFLDIIAKQDLDIHLIPPVDYKRD